jgi:hypothetical protein
MDLVVEAGRMAARELLGQTGGVLPGHTTQVIEHG